MNEHISCGIKVLVGLDTGSNIPCTDSLSLMALSSNATETHISNQFGNSVPYKNIEREYKTVFSVEKNHQHSGSSNADMKPVTLQQCGSHGETG